MAGRKSAYPFFCPFVNFTGECQWLHLELIKEMQTFCKTLFPVVEYAYSTIPTYPSGQIGYMLCSKNPVSVHTILHLPSATQLTVVRLPMNGDWFIVTAFCSISACALFLDDWYDWVPSLFLEIGNKFQGTSESTFDRGNGKYEP